MGYSQDRWERLAADLREQHTVSEVDEVVESPHGRKYIIRANLKGPNGRTFAMQSIWMSQGRFSSFVQLSRRGMMSFEL
jgi:hypothetical protein